MTKIWTISNNSN